MEEKNNTEMTTRSTEPIKENDAEKEKPNNNEDIQHIDDSEIIELLKNINIDSEDLLSLVNSLIQFSYELMSLKKIELILTNEIIDIFKKLSTKNNIKINLILSKIYMNIINNESLYTNYLVEINVEKVNMIILLIEECMALIEKLNGFAFDPDLFKFKTKVLSLIKCIYYNRKKEINNETINKKFEDYLYNVPIKFFSETYNELNSYKDEYDILKSFETYKINNFEDKYSQINNYYEQLDAFLTFVRFNSGMVTFEQVAGKDNEKIEEEKTEVDSYTKVLFYEQYGTLLLKFCKYHNYVFLNKEPEKNENPNNEEEEGDQNVKVVFLLDKIEHNGGELEKKEEEKVEEEKKEEGAEEKSEDEKKKEEEEKKKEEEEKKKEEEEKKKEEERKEEAKKENGNEDNNANGEQANTSGKNGVIEKLMDNKTFVSTVNSTEYNECIKKEINNYLKITRYLENQEKIKPIRDHMTQFLGTLSNESFIPLYLKDFGKITFSDNITPAFLVNVPAGKTSELYVETKMNETMLLYVEFTLDDSSKDINFEVNKYEIKTNSFSPIYKGEKIEDTFKFFILCGGYSLYQIIFNNDYSWFTSKDVNYRISLLKLIDREINEENKEEDKKEEENEEDKKE